MAGAGRRVMARQGRLVADGWRSYAEHVLPAGVSELQRQETRRAFYAGAWEMLSRMADLGDDDVPEDAGVRVLEATRRELVAFKESVGTAREGR